MLGAAKLRALSLEEPRRFRSDPKFVDAIGNQIGFARELRNPETVHDVGGCQLEKCWRGRRRNAHRNVQFVGGRHLKTGITDFPPELMTHDGYVESGLGFGRILNIKNNARSREKQDGDDQDGDDRPREFDLGAAKDLWRFTAIIVASTTESDDDIKEKTGDDSEDEPGDCEREVRERGDGTGRSGLRRENAGLRIARQQRSAKAQHCDPNSENDSSTLQSRSLGSWEVPTPVEHLMRSEDAKATLKMTHNRLSSPRSRTSL